MNLAEKLAQTPKLDRIDSSIESCIKIIRQELNKRKVETPGFEDYINSMFKILNEFQDDFNVMKGKK